MPSFSMTVRPPKFKALMEEWVANGVTVMDVEIFNDRQNGRADYRIVFSDGSDMFLYKNGDFTINPKRVSLKDKPSEDKPSMAEGSEQTSPASGDSAPEILIQRRGRRRKEVANV